MTDLRYVPLDHRAVLAVGGADWRTFLQGLVSNDVTRLTTGRAQFSAMLTPQGKFLHDLFLVEAGDGTVLIDTEAERADSLARKLALHRLRAQVTIAPAAGLAVFAAFGPGAGDALGLGADAAAAAPFAAGHAFADPRLPAIGARLLLPADGAAAALESAGFSLAPFASWDRARIGLGLPDGSRDLVVEKALLLEYGYEELHGVDFDKGCYMGQELTARTRYRGLVRKRLMPVACDGACPPPGTPILAGEAEAGEMRSSSGDLGLALIRLDAFRAGSALTAAGARLIPRAPDWVRFPVAE